MNNKQNVGHSNTVNVKKIKETIEATSGQMEQYTEFIRIYSEQDLEELMLEKLQKIYDNGLGLLNQYIIVMNERDKCDQTIINQMHNILNKILFIINNKLLDQSIQLVKEQEKIKKNIRDSRKSFIELKSDYKSLIPTMLGIFLGISIISTAVVGIDKIDGNYILPFISTIALLGMLMVSFMYSIYHKKPNQLIEKVMVGFCVITILLWVISWNWNISIEPKSMQNNNVELTAEVAGPLN